jgi:radical SAM protein with 4Fe4S-binding SPASM domain
VDEANAFFGEQVTSQRSLIPSWLLPSDISLIERKQKETLEKALAMHIAVPQTRFFALPANEVPAGRKRVPGFCQIVYHHCTIDAFGEVMPCEYIRFSLGNVRATPLAGILDGSRFSRFEKIYSKGFQKLRICEFCCYSL